MKLTAPHLARSAGQQRHLGDVREAIRHPDKTLTKAVDNVLARFYHDAKETSGGIELSSVPGHGTTVRVSLPVDRYDLSVQAM